MRTKGFLRRVALMLAGLLTLTVVASGQAHASPYQGKLCWAIRTNGRLKIFCIDVQVKWPWERYFECWMCGGAFDWSHDPVIREDIEGRVGEQIVSGLSLLGTAEFTRDPARRAELEAEAMGAFTTAARLNDKSAMKLGAAGIADPTLRQCQPAGDRRVDGRSARLHLILLGCRLFRRCSLLFTRLRGLFFSHALRDQTLSAQAGETPGVRSHDGPRPMAASSRQTIITH